eukprot:Rhum_TRINITY_DN11115_c0_g1::Rhum_TRINITY_DN11115_c0_g1_i1::g.42408::m.42408
MTVGTRQSAAAAAAAKKKKQRRSFDWSGYVVDRYEIGGLVGSGTFADVYEARGIPNRERVCMKIEERTQKKVQQEFSVLSRLAGCRVTPEVYELVKCPTANIMVFELLGPSLDDLLKKGDAKKLSLNTTALVAASMINCIRYVHEAGFLHRDIKPHNFVIGNRGGRDRLYIIDFGLSKSYYQTSYTTPNTIRHVPFATHRPFVGTQRYVSINAHNGNEQGRRDDLESIAYVVIYLAKGTLPWQGKGRKLEKKMRLKLISDEKQNVSIPTLCHDLPAAFAKFLVGSRQLKFEAKPDYDALIAMFWNLYDPALKLDWVESGLAQKLSDDLADRTRAGYEKNINRPAATPTPTPASSTTPFPNNTFQ